MSTQVLVSLKRTTSPFPPRRGRVWFLLIKRPPVPQLPSACCPKQNRLVCRSHCGRSREPIASGTEAEKSQSGLTCGRCDRGHSREPRFVLIRQSQGSSARERSLPS